MHTWTLTVDTAAGRTTSTSTDTQPERAAAGAELLAAAAGALAAAVGPATLHLEIDGTPLAVVRLQNGPDGTPDRASALDYLGHVRHALTDGDSDV
ncbi:hypothetical protein [Nocardia sp. NBC_01327]|uniref:hypothetical protein n=1 Tax=Nocardia sp. NBC_01327 TaxID=2903593 RepID=UPI002E0D5227|nr:hypothetical protein OG326_23610 [Nocardia sp. NBC_01327]